MSDLRENMYHELMETIRFLPVVDTHEHLIPEGMRTQEVIDFYTVTLSHYAGSDLISAGMTAMQKERMMRPETPPHEKVALFMPYWRRMSNTAYGRALKLAARGLYEIETIDESTLPELSRRMAEQNKPGLYKQILEERCGIKYCLWDQFYEAQPIKDDFFRLALRLDDIVSINSADDIQKLEEKYHIEIRSPEALEDIMEICITSHKPRGLTAIKTALAYQRTLDFEPIVRAEAVLSMDKILRGRFTERDARVLQDYMMFSMAQKAGWHNLTVQVHTGLLEGNGNYIMNANPALLSSLVMHNPNTRFDLFHGGYPYGGELSAMAKMFSNVYLDMAWLHVISPAYTRRYLHEWLDMVPISKIMGFGGDYLFVEGVYGHLQIARENIARVLAERVTDGDSTLDEAKRYAAMMLYDNPDALFGAQK